MEASTPRHRSPRMLEDVETRRIERRTGQRRSTHGIFGSARRLRAVGRLLRVVALVTGSNLARRLGADRSSPQTSAQRLARRLIRGLRFRTAVHGAPPAGVALFVANHRSYVDVPLLMAHVRGIFLAKQEIASWPAFGTASRFAETIFVQRDNRVSRKRALAAIRRRLVEGLPVVVFPEGTSSAGPGILPFRRGSFHVAAELSVPVIPVAIHYADPRDAWVDDQTFLRHFLDRFSDGPPQATLSFGPALTGDDGGRLAVRAEGWIRRDLRIRERDTEAAAVIVPAWSR